MTRTQLAICLLALTPVAALAQTPSATGNWLSLRQLLRHAPLHPPQSPADRRQTHRHLPRIQTRRHPPRRHISPLRHRRGRATPLELNGTIANGTLQATDTEIDADNKANPVTLKITATLAPALTHPTSQRHEFTPTVFYRQFSPLNKPVLTINPGDTIHTTTVDAGGNDLNGVKRSSAATRKPGPSSSPAPCPATSSSSTSTSSRLNRDWAGSDDGLDERAMDSNLAVKMKDNGKGIRWNLDRTAGTATPDKPAEHLKHYTIPLKPMLGCIAAAPGTAQAPPGTGDSGGYGGNMDFNQITEGATVYLRVSNPGALLYFGDGHAVQGDGELNGNALETSMDVDLTVDVIPNKRINGPRIENATDIIAMGLAGSIDDAFKAATSDMATWLAEDYKLTPSEIAQVLGTAAEYHVSEVADRNAGVILKINKARLATLTK